jgi:S1-C subfamily serine protease
MDRKNIFKIVAFFVIGMIGGIFSDQILCPYLVERPLFNKYQLEKNPAYVIEKKETVVQENTALTDAIEKVEKTIIGLRSQNASGTFEGSGLIVTSDGLMVTLADLVPQGSNFAFFLAGKAVSYQILKRDLNKNLTLVKLGESNLPAVSFANLDELKLGERVFLIGEVLDKKESYKVVNEGIVRKFDEDLIETNMSEKNVLKGSPLFNIKGEVLGINTINPEGRVVAIPISKIKEFIGL